MCPMPKVAISYRRTDSDAITGRIFDRLVARYGSESVFRDIDNMPAGVDFRHHIDKIVSQSDVVLAIVGPRWVGSSKSGAETGRGTVSPPGTLACRHPQPAAGPLVPFDGTWLISFDPVRVFTFYARVKGKNSADLETAHGRVSDRKIAARCPRCSARPVEC